MNSCLRFLVLGESDWGLKKIINELGNIIDTLACIVQGIGHARALNAGSLRLIVIQILEESQEEVIICVAIRKGRRIVMAIISVPRYIVRR